MKTGEWVKIGEATKLPPVFKGGNYAKYAIMEYIYSNGFRKYKEVLMCTWSDNLIIESQKNAN